MAANDPHYDAKLFVAAHPHGTGSVLSEPYSGSPKQHAKNRCTLIQSWFRRTAIWAFWKLDSIIKNDLFNINMRNRRRDKSASSGDDPDGFTRNVGTAIPQNIPESSAWWKMQAKDLFALTEEGEMGMMQSMVTITHNDYVPELLASVRRGPFANPTESEMVEYLLTRVKADRHRPKFEDFALEHAMS